MPRARLPAHFIDVLYLAVNTDYDRVDESKSEFVVNDTLILNHYVLRSREEFEEKIARGTGLGGR